MTNWLALSIFFSTATPSWMPSTSMTAERFELTFTDEIPVPTYNGRLASRSIPYSPPRFLNLSDSSFVSTISPLCRDAG